MSMIIGTNKVIMVLEFAVPPHLPVEAVKQMTPATAIPLGLIPLLQSSVTYSGSVGMVEAVLAQVRQQFEGGGLAS